MPTNKLIHETSPYLLQHAHNPVHWYPWGDEAFGVARRENKPVLLSIGYSACHWCHVMEHESFENEEIAALMNEHFVSIKVDREERPDLDEIYMNAVQMLTGRGGWPMTLFLTPEGKPFFGGTYFPPEDRYGVHGFPKVLKGAAQAFHERPEQVARSVQQIIDGLNRLSNFTASERSFSFDTVLKSAEALSESYDHDHGGLGRAPKFPNVGVLELFLRHHRHSGERRYLDMVVHTLTQMAQGGIYDHLGGGFHRYSVDEKWLVPHFEKMLYDNAQLLGIYADAFRVTQDPLFKRVVEETVDYLLREMFDPEGGFYSTQDADSEGEEGKFFVWARGEVMGILGGEEGEIFCRIYDVGEVGNFEGKNILHPTLTLEQAAKFFKKDPQAIDKILRQSRAKLLEVREKRVKPFRDEKILTSWNGLILSGIAEACKVTDNTNLREAAERTVEFFYSKMFQGEFLLHTYKDGQAKLRGDLDDYAFFAAGLLDLYEVLYEGTLLQRAEQLAELMIREFWDDNNGAFFYTGHSHEQLIGRTKPAFDASVPSGNSVATQLLLRLYHYTGKEDYLKKAEKVLRLYHDGMENQPFGLTAMLCGLDFYLEGPKEVVFVGQRKDQAMRDLLGEFQSFYHPNKTLQVVEPGEPLGKISPLLEGKSQIDGKPTVYVCQNFTCSAPVTEWEDLKRLMES
ncbi:MAG: thioredoxin domain-containing protein [Candidatus Binatia bacterium]